MKTKELPGKPSIGADVLFTFDVDGNRRERSARIVDVDHRRGEVTLCVFIAHADEVGELSCAAIVRDGAGQNLQIPVATVLREGVPYDQSGKTERSWRYR